MSFLAERRIRHWLANAFQSRSWERFDSLPIPRVDGRFADRGLWVDGARWCLVRAIAAHRRARYPLSVAVSVELCDAKPGEPFPRTPQELQAALGESPPALTAFPPGGELDDLASERSVHPAVLGLDDAPDLVCAESSWSLPEEPERQFRALYAGVLAPPEGR